MLRYLTAGESHGSALVAILEGCPANLSLSEDDINRELERRQQGYGRGPRMKEIEKDQAEIISGIRNGKTIGSPISLRIPNRSTELFEKTVTEPRPGHADLVGALKYNHKDIRNVIERASARETAAKVAVGAVAKRILSEFKINVFSKVIQIGNPTIVGKPQNEEDWKKLIDKAKEEGDSLGGIFEITATGVPVGLGSYVHSDRRLDGILAQAVMAIPAVKGVEIGLGFGVVGLPGSKLQDEIFYNKTKGFYHKTNNAGGIEGGVTNGEPLVIRAAVKPIATIKKSLQSVDLVSRKTCEALVERSDVCAVEPAAVVGEAVVALELAKAFLDKFGGDSIEDTSISFKAYLARIV